MKKARFDGLLFLLLGCVLFVSEGVDIERTSFVSSVDFKAVYYSARCLVQHCDPYSESQMLRLYRQQLGAGPRELPQLLPIVTRFIYLPTVFAFTAVFGLVPYGLAHVIWMVVTASVVILAAFLMWSMGSCGALRISGVLLCVLLAGSELLIEVGNPAGIAIGFCVIAVWCFLRERYVWVGILCLAFSLLIKPHDSGFIWLYFLLAGGVFRKRALQTMALTLALAIPSVLWVTHVAPAWVQEMRTNLSTVSAHGDLSDPGVSSFDAKTHGAQMISLQTVIAVFRDDPRIYNLVTYLLCAPLLLVWGFVTLRSPSSAANAWLALAAIAPLSMLPLYHRQQDTRLLLLTFPAFAMLWVEGGAVKRTALLVNGLGVLLTGDLPLQILAVVTNPLVASTHGVAGKILNIVFDRPAPLILFGMAVFYLWIYVQRTLTPSSDLRDDIREPSKTFPAASTA